MMFGMKLFRNRAAVLQDLEAKIQDGLAQIPALVESAMPSRRSKTHPLAITAAWVAAGVGVLTLGLIAGRELRIRYKLKRRTPYDYYAQAGDPQDLEFGIGI
jgi:hypothetical protein